jgi:hypothetical protein
MGRHKLFTEEEENLIESILYYQYRIDKAWQELFKTRDKRSIWNKLGKVRDKRNEIY